MKAKKQKAQTKAKGEGKTGTHFNPELGRETRFYDPDQAAKDDPKLAWDGRPHGGLTGKQLQKELAECEVATMELVKISEQNRLARRLGCPSASHLWLVEELRARSEKATEEHATPNEAILLVLRDRKKPDPFLTVPVRVTEKRLAELLVTLWFWDGVKKRPFRQTSGQREYLPPVLGDADEVCLRTTLERPVSQFVTSRKDARGVVHFTDCQDYRDSNIRIRRFELPGADRGRQRYNFFHFHELVPRHVEEADYGDALEGALSSSNSGLNVWQVLNPELPRDLLEFFERLT